MIKQITVAECDVCGKTEKAKEVSGRYNETEYVIPEGWKQGRNDKVSICPRCAAKLWPTVYGDEIKEKMSDIITAAPLWERT